MWRNETRRTWLARRIARLSCLGTLLGALACGGDPKPAADAETMNTGGASDGGKGGTGNAPTTGDPNVYVFLLIGQSNMEGMAQPEAEDRKLNNRVKMLQYTDCTNTARKYNTWYTAIPPLHSCFAGVGPGDYFGKALADAYPEATIGLVPLGIAGVDIDFFRKGVVSARRAEFKIPPDDHWEGAYEWVLERARLAQEMGTIRGIIFHQGESDTGQAAWLDKVQGMVADLRSDLGIGEVPFIAGELLYGACCDAHNPIIAQIPDRIPNSFVVSAEGLTGQDDAHFDLAAQRELGKRYGQQMIDALR